MSPRRTTPKKTTPKKKKGGAKSFKTPKSAKKSTNSAITEPVVDTTPAAPPVAIIPFLPITLDAEMSDIAKRLGLAIPGKVDKMTWTEFRRFWRFMGFEFIDKLPGSASKFSALPGEADPRFTGRSFVIHKLHLGRPTTLYHYKAYPYGRAAAKGLGLTSDESKLATFKLTE